MMKIGIIQSVLILNQLFCTYPIHVRLIFFYDLDM